MLKGLLEEEEDKEGPSNSTFEYLSEETQDTKLKRHMYPYVLCIIIYNSQDIKVSKCPYTDE